ncbi:MAG TPA: hypothetical protein PLS62_04210 [Desulfobacteraceae bacterium]|nr:hypothetical protein [Desulfobacteraceae bacterium]
MKRTEHALDSQYHYAYIQYVSCIKRFSENLRKWAIFFCLTYIEFRQARKKSPVRSRIKGGVTSLWLGQRKELRYSLFRRNDNCWTFHEAINIYLERDLEIFRRYGKLASNLI